jgi:hypothetical protein
MEGDAVGADLGELLDDVHDVEWRARRPAKRVSAAPPDGPKAE